MSGTEVFVLLAALFIPAVWGWAASRLYLWLRLDQRLASSDEPSRPSSDQAVEMWDYQI
jgi:hypothetical protein